MEKKKKRKPAKNCRTNRRRNKIDFQLRKKRLDQSIKLIKSELISLCFISQIFHASRKLKVGVCALAMTRVIWEILQTQNFKTERNFIKNSRKLLKKSRHWWMTSLKKSKVDLPTFALYTTRTLFINFLI